jgi:LacI family transcriptional regulator
MNFRQSLFTNAIFYFVNATIKLNWGLVPGLYFWVGSMRRVSLLIETSRTYGRRLLQGVAKYLREINHWSVTYRPDGWGKAYGAYPPTWIKNWDGDGMLAFVAEKKMAKVLQPYQGKVIDLCAEVPEAGFPWVAPDIHLGSKMAVDHLLERGFQRMAVCGLRRGEGPYLDQRCDELKKCIQNQGLDCYEFKPRGGGAHGLSWEREQIQIGQWIESLPKPIGVIACNDIRGREVLEACKAIPVNVPEQVAVLGMGNDDLLCSLCDPLLSSVESQAEKIGYLAAQLLDQLMDGKQIPGVNLVPPARVVTRQSTDTLAIEDERIARALTYIREHFLEPIRVADVVAQVGIERRELERGFRAYIKRSPKNEVIRLRMELAQRLLLETDLSATQVASRCGFSSLPYFMDLFRRKVGFTPQKFRRGGRRDGEG